MRSLISRLPFALLLAVVVVFAMETAARVEDRLRYGTDWFSPYREPAEMIVRDADGVHGARSVRFQKWVMNNLGFRGPDVDSLPAPGTLRVVATGASETYGLYESPDREYPRQLEDSLQAAIPLRACEGFRRAEVLNAAMAGMTLPTVGQDVRLRLRRFAPAVVTYYPTPSQYLVDTPPSAAGRDSSGTTQIARGWRRGLHPRILDRLREQAKLLLPRVVQDRLRVRSIAAQVASHPPGWRFDTLPIDRLDAFEADLRRLVGDIRAIGAVPVLGTHGSMFARGVVPDSVPLRMWQRFNPRATLPVILAFDSAAASRTRLVAQDSAVALADVAMDVRPEGFSDNIHFNDAGAAVAAAAFARAVERAVAAGACHSSPDTAGAAATALGHSTPP